MTCKDIIIAYLRDHGFDGLCNPDYECGCGLDGYGFMPCDGDPSECEPAHIRKCQGCDKFAECDLDAKEDLDGCFHVIIEEQSK